MIADRACIALSSALILSGPALAADGPFTFEHEIKADTVAALSSADEERLLGDLDARFSAETITGEGRRFGAVLGLRAQRDPLRRAMARRVGRCPTAQPGCPEAGGRAPAGLLSGFHAAGTLDTDAVRAELETAYLYVKTGLFEVRAGRGEGAAVLEADPLPGAFRLMRADGPLVDPDGLSLASTRNDLSAGSAKLTVQSRRLAGFRASASFTPDADFCGVDACRLETRPGGPVVAEIDNVAEAGLSFDHLFRSTRTRWSAALTVSRGQAAGAFASAFDDPWAAGARLAWEKGDWSAGLAWLRSNDGFAHGSYSAWSASAAYERGPWLTALEWARGDSDLVDAQGWSVQLGSSRLFDNGALAGIGLRHGRQSAPAGHGAARERESRTTLFAEAGLRF